MSERVAVSERESERVAVCVRERGSQWQCVRDGERVAIKERERENGNKRDRAREWQQESKSESVAVLERELESDSVRESERVAVSERESGAGRGREAPPRPRKATSHNFRTRCFALWYKTYVKPQLFNILISGLLFESSTERYTVQSRSVNVETTPATSRDHPGSHTGIP